MVGTALPPRLVSRAISGGIEAHVLGAFDLVAAGHRVEHADWQRASAERLVKLLLVTPGHALSREAAAETLWPGAEPEASRANLRKAIHFAGRALGDAAVLTAEPGKVGFDLAGLDLDLDRLRAAFDLVAESPPRHGGGTAGDSDEAEGSDVGRAIDLVLSLGPRELLPDDAYEEWLAAPRERLQHRWRTVAILAARRARDLGMADRAHAIADQLLDRDPTDEAAHRLVIELLAAEGRHHAARMQFEMCRRALREQLDVEPAPETVETFGAAERVASRTPGPVTSMPRLVARHAELERIEVLLDRVAGGNPASLVVRGPTGIGKTRLLQEVVGYARAGDWRVLAWQAVESGGTSAYAPLRHHFADALTADGIAAWAEPARSGIAAIAPGLGLAGTIEFADRGALVDALVLAIEHLARSRPLAFAIDDLQWLDPSTLELLERLVTEPTSGPILVAGTFRDDEPAPEPMRRLLGRVRPPAGIDLAIGPLALVDIEALIVGNLGGTSVDPALARQAFEQSEGNPLFCLELVRAGRDHGTIRLAGQRWTTTSGSCRRQPGQPPAARSEERQPRRCRRHPRPSDDSSPIARPA